MLLAKLLAWITASFGALSACVALFGLFSSPSRVASPESGRVAVLFLALLSVVLISTAARFLWKPTTHRVLRVAKTGSFVVSAILYSLAKRVVLQQSLRPALALLCIGAGVLLYYALLKPYFTALFAPESEKA